MRALTCIVVAAIVAGCQSAASRLPEGSQPQVQYISDPSAFKSAAAAAISAEEKWAVSRTQQYLEERFAKPVRGAFAVAATASGYHVNFHSLEILEGGRWTPVREGFGEAWLQAGKVIRADVGP
jgi:hypothetical protein